jgi:hypothetical protein
MSCINAVEIAKSIDSKSPWPNVDLLQNFSFPLQRLTTYMKSRKKWYSRFFVIQNHRLYYSDGKNGYPDSKEGTLSFVSSDPQPGRRYCVDLAGSSPYISL